MYLTMVEKIQTMSCHNTQYAASRYQVYLTMDSWVYTKEDSDSMNIMKKSHTRWGILGRGVLDVECSSLYNVHLSNSKCPIRCHSGYSRIEGIEWLLYITYWYWLALHPWIRLTCSMLSVLWTLGSASNSDIKIMFVIIISIILLLIKVLLIKVDHIQQIYSRTSYRTTIHLNQGHMIACNSSGVIRNKLWVGETQ